MHIWKTPFLAIVLLVMPLSSAFGYTYSFNKGAPVAEGAGYVEFMNTQALTNIVPGAFDFDARSSFTANTEFTINPGDTGTAALMWSLDLSGLLEAYGFLTQARSQYIFVLYQPGGDTLLRLEDLIEERTSSLGTSSVSLDVHQSGSLNLALNTRYALDLYFWNTTMASELEEDPVGAYASIDMEEAVFRLTESQNGPVPTPEPATALLLLLGLPALIPLSRKR